MVTVAVPADCYDPGDGTDQCLLCGHPEYTPFVRNESFGIPVRFARCTCELVKQTPMPNERFFEWFFNSDLFVSAKESGSSQIWGFYDYLNDEDCRLATSRLRYRRLLAVFDSGRPLNIMKIGPSTGTFLHVANEHGHNAVGCDISSRFIDYAREHYGVRIDRGRFERLNYARNQFDVIMLFNVIENIPNLDQFLAAVRRTLKAGGYFILNYVDMEHNLIAALQRERYFLYRPPVCHVFNRRTMNAVLEKYGFEIRQCLRDVRYLHMEKMLSLLGWVRLLKALERFKVHRIPFPIYSYPSRIVIARRGS